MALLIDPIEFAELRRRQAEEAALPNDLPERFPAILERLPGGLAPATATAIARPRATVMAWHFRQSSIFAALLGRLRVYMCWGVAHHQGWRRAVARLVLRRARTVLVNDDSTAAEVRRLAGVQAHRVPYLVDPRFFTYASPEDRDGFLFCPSANDRDGDVLLALAAAGRRVVWLSNDEAQHRCYADRHPRLTMMSHISYAALRDLYRRAAAVVLPLVRDVHAAGQTTTLEAIACGAPVILSPGRTAELLRSHGLLREVSGGVEDWMRAIDSAIAANRTDPAPGRAAAEAIAQTHGPGVFLAALSRHLGRPA